MGNELVPAHLNKLVFKFDDNYKEKSLYMMIRNVKKVEIQNIDGSI
jgi:hypothetical protein